MLTELIDKRARSWEQSQAIIDKARKEKRELTGEEQQEFDKLHEEQQRLKGSIDRFQLHEATERELHESRGRLTDTPRPEVPVPTPSPVRTNEDDKLRALKTWALAGSDYRTKLTPPEIEVARRVGFDINAKQIDFMLRPKAARSVRELDEQYRAQGVTTGPAGLYTVPDELMRSLEVALLQFGGMRQVATIFRTDSGADMPIPTVNDTTQTGALLGENTSVAAQDVTFSQLVLNSFKYSSKLVLVSVELMQDNAINLASFLGDALGTRIGRITNTHFTLGTGTSNPFGIMSAATIGKTGATGQLSSVLYDDLVDMEHSVDPAYRAGASWMFHDQTLKAIKKLKDTSGRPLWLPGMAGGAPDTILGYPYVINQDVAQMTAGARTIAFGALSKYIIREVTGVTLLRLDERYADFHQVAFLAFARYDGDLLNAGTHPVKVFAHATT